MNIVVKESYEEMSSACAEYIGEYIKANSGKVLCFAAGDTPLGILQNLIKMQEKGEINLASMYYAGLDEWVELGYEDKGSCKQFMEDNFYTPAKIPVENIRVFDGKANPDEETKAVLEFIKNKGGLGMAVLGIGMNGHIGFNEPGTSVDFAGGKILLSESSVTVGQKYFNKKYNLKYGVTLGIKTLVESEKVVLIANGEKKADIVANSLKEKENPAFPASYLTTHSDYHVFLDNAAYFKIKS